MLEKRAIMTFMAVILAAASVIIYQGARTAQAKEPLDSAAVSEKLDRILRNQQSIMQSLEEVKKELYVVKIRATRK